MKPLASFRSCILFILISFSLTAKTQDYIAFYEAKYALPDLYEHSLGLSMDPAVSAKTLIAFGKLFKNVKDVNWFTVEDKFMAKFSREGTNTRVLFDKKGNMLYSISDGTEKNLPQAIRKMVRSFYFDYLITTSLEVHSLGKTSWIVKLQDDQSMITIKIADGKMEETENYRLSR